ncbi:MAG: zinc ribbon domain-containing protein [Ruminococcus sp.]|jgi:hypothetical protein|nr:zinc ribbon domain-containing protein [Ruminococcus sp.]
MNEIYEKLICPTCGNENDTENVFCGQCGTRLKNETLPAENTEAPEEVAEPIEEATEPTEEAVEPTEEIIETTEEIAEPEPPQATTARKFPTAPVLLAAGIVIAVALLTMLTNYVSGGGSDDLSPKAYPIVLQNDRDNHFILAGYGDEPWIIEKEIDRRASSAISKNGAGTLLSVDSRAETALYYITEKTELSLDLITINGMAISDNGNAFLYIVQNTTGKNDYTVNFYRNGINDGDSEMLSDTAYRKGIALSPNGSAVSFTADFDNETENYTTYIKVGNVTNELGQNMEVAALADNAKYIYYYKNDAFYVQQGFDESTRVKIAVKDGFGRPNVVGYSADYSQVVCVETKADIGSRTYISENGGEPIKIANEQLHLVYSEKRTADLKKSVYYTASGYDSFSYTLYRLNRDLEPERIAKDIEKYQITEDGKTVFYLKNNDIYKISTSGGEDERIAEDAIDFEASENGKAVYFKTEDNELYCIKNGESTLVTYDLDAFSVSGGDVYYLDGTEVYKSTGGRGKIIGEADISLTGIDRTMSRIVMHESGYLILYFYQNDGDTSATFISKDSKSFINIADM